MELTQIHLRGEKHADTSRPASTLNFNDIIHKALPELELDAGTPIQQQAGVLFCENQYIVSFYPELGLNIPFIHCIPCVFCAIIKVCTLRSDNNGIISPTAIF